MITAEKIGVRVATPADVDEIIRLLRKDDFGSEHSPDTFRKLFTYNWLNKKPNLGFVLTENDRIHGFLGAIYSERLMNGQVHKFCNTTTWYVEPEYRTKSLLLLMAVLGMRTNTLTTFTASEPVGNCLRKLGFARLGHNRLLYRPGSALLTLRRPPPQIIDDPELIRMIVLPSHCRLLDDHLPYNCKHYVLIENDRYCYVITKRRRVRRSTMFGNVPISRLKRGHAPVTDILFMSDPDLAFRHWERLKLRMMWRERTWAVTVDDWKVGPGGPRGVPIPFPSYVYRLRTDVQNLDTLYSELVLLPI